MPFYEEIVWEQAACRGIDTEMFYRPEEVRKADPVLYLDPIRAVCASCPIWASCLAYAEIHEFYGIWGGMTTIERQSLTDSSKKMIKQNVLAAFAALGISAHQIYEALEVNRL